MGQRMLRTATDDIVTEEVRKGSIPAFEELYLRHVHAAKSTARYMLRNDHDADDVVGDAFAGVLSALNNGAGPREANFRSYLLACVRNGCVARSRQRDNAIPVDPTDFDDTPVAFEDTERFVEADTLTKAYSSLPAPWQRVLWMTEVEDRPLDDVAQLLKLRKPAASALSYRAHQGLTEAYLGHAITNRPDDAACQAVAGQLAKFVRGKCRSAARRSVQAHLDGCDTCRALVGELDNANHHLRGLMIAPIALGAFLMDRSKAHGADVTATVSAATKAARFTARHAARFQLQAAVVVTVGMLTFAPESSNATVAADSAYIDDAGAASIRDEVAIDPTGGRPTGTLAETTVVTDAVTEPVGAPVRSDPTIASTPVSTAPTPPVVPGASVPEVITTGVVTIPPTSAPPIVASPVPVSPLTVPPLTVPPLTVPPLTVPPLTIPPLTIPPVTVPPVTVPPVTVPPATLPPATLPPGPRAPQISLGAATSFGVLAATGVTSTGATTITGDVGTSGGTITGLAPGQLTGTIASLIDSIARQLDVTTASSQIAALTPAALPSVDLGGQTLAPGIYSSGTLGMTGTLVLDGLGDRDALFVFKSSTTLITASASRVVFVNGAQPCNVFWDVGTAATLGTFSEMAGTVIAATSITATTGVVVNGRLIARNAAVTLDTNRVVVPACS
ncbi:MAG: sigma-70 family RNA polymerase sigma factor [Ilumatobacteraceae bacterium]